MATATELQQLYVAYFGRPADPAGLGYWVSSGISTKSFAAVMFAQPEFQSVNSGLSVETQVNQLYINLFGRNADAAGLLYWTNQINTGQIALASVANDLIFSATNSGAASAADLTALTNKTSTAVSYTAGLLAAADALLAYQPQSTSPWISGANFAAAVSFMTTATATNIPTAAQITASVNSVGGAGIQGQTFTLTSGVDSGTSFTGNANANTFNAGLTTAGGNTLNALDSLDGAGGTDTLNATIVTGVTPGAITNIEVVNVTFNAGVTLNASNMSGMTSIKNIGSGFVGTISNLSSTTPALSVIDNAAGATFTYQANAVTGTGDTVNLTVNNVTAGTTTITGAIETLNLTSSGSANNLRLDSGATTLNIAGDQAITLAAASTVLASATTINAGTATGVVTLASDAAAGVAVSVTGGSGNDVLTLAGTNTATDTINGGAGNDRIIFTTDLANADIINGGAGTDTLVGTTANLNALTTANNISNIEVVEVSNAHTTALTTANIGTGINSVTLANGANAGAVTFGAGTNTLTIAGTANAGALTVNDTGLATTDVLNVTLSNAVNSLNAEDFTVNGFETVNINTGTATAKTVNDLVINGDPDQAGVATAATLNLSGAANFSTVTVGLDAASLVLGGTTAAGVINASAMTGNFVMGAAAVGVRTITGGAGDDTILGDNQVSTLSGGAGVDTILGGTAVDTIDGGAGNDIINGSGGADIVTGGAGNDSFLYTDAQLLAATSISGSDGTDTLQMQDITQVTDAQLANKTSIEVLTSAATGMDVILDDNGQASGIATITLAGTTANGIADRIEIQDGVTRAMTVNVDAAVANDTNTIVATAYTGALTVNMASATAINIDAGVTTALTGGTGTSDTLNVVGDTFTAAQLGSVTAIENFVVSNDATASFTLADANVADGRSLTIDGRAIVNTANGLTVSAALEADGAVTVHGSAGVDTFTLSISDLGDTFRGYGGNDGFTVNAAQLTTLDTLDGGVGTDTLTLSSADAIVDADLTNVSNFETLAVAAGGSTLTLGAQYAEAGFATITGSTGINSITLGAGVTRAQTVALVAGTDTVTASAMTAALNVTVAEDNLTAADTLTAGSTGTDVLTVTFDNSNADALTGTEMAAVTGFEQIVAASDAAASLATADANVAATASLTVDMTANASAASVVDISLETNGAITILGGAGGNTITLSGSSMGDRFIGGTGTDNITVATAALDQLDTINGVSGTDTLIFSDNGIISDADFTNVTNIDAVTLGVGGTNTFVLGAEYAGSGAVTLNLSNDAANAITHNVTIGAGVNTAQTIVLGTEAHVVNAAATSAAMTFTVADANLADADTITGGTGSDTLTITFTAGDGTVVAGDMLNVTRVETIRTASNVAGTLNLNDANNVSGVLTVNATANTTASFTLNASAEDDGTIVYVGGAGVDTVTGTTGADTIGGGAGADVITGGNGADVITGGAGNDRFVYTAVAQSTGTARDRIADFTSAADGFNVTLDLNAQVNAVTVDATVQTARAGTAAVQTNMSGAVGQVFYDTENSRLIINANADNLVTTLDYQIDVNAAATAANTIVEGDINFTVTGGSAGDTITTGGGADTINGGGAADTIVAGAGADTITGGAGNDNLTGGTGNDQFTIDAGDDVITDLTTGDIVDVAAGATVSATNVTAFVATSATQNLGSAAADFVINSAAAGSTVTMTLATVTTAGSDGFTLTGGAGVDVLTGSSGDDTITGGANTDTITGGAGADTITGGAGADRIDGGLGNDTYFFGASDTGIGTITGAISMAVANLDIITANAGDILNLTTLLESEGDYDNLTEVAAGQNITTTLTTNEVGQFVGVYDSATGLFTSVAGGAAGTASATDVDAIMFSAANADATDTTATDFIVVLGVAAQIDGAILNGVITLA